MKRKPLKFAIALAALLVMGWVGYMLVGPDAPAPTQGPVRMELDPTDYPEIRDSLKVYAENAAILVFVELKDADLKSEEAFQKAAIDILTRHGLENDVMPRIGVDCDLYLSLDLPAWHLAATTSTSKPALTLTSKPALSEKIAAYFRTHVDGREAVACISFDSVTRGVRFASDRTLKFSAKYLKIPIRNNLPDAAGVSSTTQPVSPQPATTQLLAEPMPGFSHPPTPKVNR